MPSRHPGTSDRPLTVAELREKLAELDGDAVVRGYEGEGGSWIIVEDKVRVPGEGPPETLAEFHTPSR